MDALLVDINQAGLGRGLQFELFRPAPSETTREFYAELPIAIKLTGNYHDMGAFASDIGQLPRIVTLNDIALNVGKDGTLTMDTTAKTFRYLDEEELAAQRSAAESGEGGEEMKRPVLIIAAALLVAGCESGEQQELKSELDGPDQGPARQGPAAAGGEAVRAGALHRLRPPRSVRPGEDRAGGQGHRAGNRGRAQARPQPAERAARGVPARVAPDGRHARAQPRRRSGWCARTPGCIASGWATTWDRISASSPKITEAEIKLRELFQDAGGDWAERESTLLLQEADAKEARK